MGDPTEGTSQPDWWCCDADYPEHSATCRHQESALVRRSCGHFEAMDSRDRSTREEAETKLCLACWQAQAAAESPIGLPLEEMALLSSGTATPKGRRESSAAAWDTVAAFFDGAALLRRAAFLDLMAPLYGGDRPYAEGVWPQFQAAPWGFCRNRNPEEPGRILFAACLKLRMDYRKARAEERSFDA